MKHATLTTTCLLILLLTGCGSTPTQNFYVLSAGQGPDPSGETPSLGVGPISVPEYLNRNTLVYRRDGNQLQIARYERWAEPLEEGIARVLRLNLARLLNTEDIRPFPWHPDRAPDFGIKVTLLALDADEYGAELEAEWLIHRPATSEAVSRRISRFRHASQGEELTPDRLPAIYSDLIYQLSEEIAAAIPNGSDAS
jgi:uncharacterized lipoprotein YmbA